MNQLGATNLPLLQLKYGPEILALKELHSTFIRNVEHELRTPLTAMHGYTELLRDGYLGELMPEQKQAVSVIMDRACQMRVIVDRIAILLSSIARTGVSIPVALSEMIAQLIEKRRVQAEKKGLTLRLRLDRNLPVVRGDPYQLQEAFDCLIENAIKFTPPGGRVEVRGHTEDGWACLAICDTGIGIEPDKLPYLDTGFFQADGSLTRQYGGLGLGLTLACSIVEAHSGHIHVESQPGQGSRFIVKLPASSSNDDRRSSGTRLPRILLVDDEENVALTIQAGLRMLLECEITIATNGEQALRLFEANPFDLLITDYKMPGMDGPALAARIRQLDPQVGIVLITGYGDNHVRHRAALVPIQVILNKPVNLTDLQLAALDALNGNRGL